MSETFTPLQSPYAPHEQSSFSKKQIFGAVTTLGLLVAIGGSFLYINNVQTRSTKAFSTNECVAAGGFEWHADSCPGGGSQLGSINNDGQLSNSDTGGTYLCCPANNSVNNINSTSQTGTQSTTQTGTQSTSPGGDGDQTQVTPPGSLVTPPACNLPVPQLEINCPDSRCLRS